MAIKLGLACGLLALGAIAAHITYPYADAWLERFAARQEVRMRGGAPPEAKAAQGRYIGAKAQWGQAYVADLLTPQDTALVCLTAADWLGHIADRREWRDDAIALKAMTAYCESAGLPLSDGAWGAMTRDDWDAAARTLGLAYNGADDAIPPVYYSNPDSARLAAPEPPSMEGRE